MDEKENKLLKVINVGQGDSIILSPPPVCKFYKEDNADIFIDIGDGKTDVIGLSNYNKKRIILLSHSHKDHIGGLSYLTNHKDTVKELWIPLWYDEILLITDFLLKLKHIHNIPQDTESLIEAKNTIACSRLIKNLSGYLNIPIRACRSGMRMCDHIYFLNPPQSIQNIFSVSTIKIDEFLDLQFSSGFSEFRRYIDENKFDTIRNTILTEGWTYNGSSLQGREETSFADRRRFFYGFILKSRKSIQKFIEQPNRHSFNQLYKNLRLLSNDCSIVMKCEFDDLNVLFPGDVSKKVFNRLIREKQLTETKILKVPHHGSKSSLDYKIMEYLKPKLAIISHGNGLFGRAKDRHPNREIVDMLNKLGIDTLYTNEFIKDGIHYNKRNYKDQHDEIELIEP